MYEGEVVDILEDGSAIIEFSEEMCKELGWQEGDSLTIKLENDIITITKKDGSKSTD
jgi:formylmethanofuran dehydrogenase subunit D